MSGGMPAARLNPDLAQKIRQLTAEAKQSESARSEKWRELPARCLFTSTWVVHWR
jgi:hypothetical protein